MDPRVEVEIARRYLVDGWQSFKNDGEGLGGGRAWGIQQNQYDTKNCATVWHALPTRILAASPHLQGHDVPGEEIDRLKEQGLTLLEALEELGIA